MRQMVDYKRLNTTVNSLNFQPQKVVVVAYRRWSFTRSSNCKALTRNVLVFWIFDRLWEVVLREAFAHGGSTVCIGPELISGSLL